MVCDVNAAVDHPPQMLGEVAEEVGMDFADGAVSVDLDAVLRGLPLYRERPAEKSTKGLNHKDHKEHKGN